MGPISRIVLAAMTAGTLAGCGAINDPRGLRDALDGALIFGDDSPDKAMNFLARGDYPNAERHAIAALRKNPKDPYALYVSGMVYQATGRYDLARQYYEVILVNRPQVTITVLAEGAPQVKTLMDVAQANIRVIDKLTGRHVPRTASQAGRTPETVLPSGEPVMPAGIGRGAVSAQPLDGAAAAGGVQAEANVASRFRILKRLLDEGLVTQDEYSRRRGTNLGALTPYSAATPPAQGLERPGPTDAQVVDRLKDLAKALETRAISPTEHAAERSAILDALLQAEPRRMELPALPPRDVMEAATAVGRVERLRAAGLVSGEEAGKERAAIERQLDSQLAKVPVSGTATGLRQGAPPPANAGGAKPGGAPGVQLGTARTEEAARQTWDKIKAKFPEELGSFNAAMYQQNLGEKGVRWRIVAGPLKSRDEAVKLCKILKLHRQSCETASF
ncbi:conserved hypothetical protein [Magnetospirillum sp. SS-4]|nr:conserved hypothetical protein [Magnetospirillum sp. SS-4]